MQFEKWQALGNDYVILEDSEALELTPARVRAICAPHTGVGADGIVLVSRAPDPDHDAAIRVFNPDGSEAEVSGNGAREAIMYLRRHGALSADTARISTAAGTLSATITSSTTCTVQIGTARLSSDDYPGGDPDGLGELESGGHTWRFRHVNVGNPQCAIRCASEPELAALDLPAYGPGIEANALFPNRTNVSWFAELAAGRIRARIFERGVGETSASGTGASGAAVAYVLDGGSSPVTVVLDGGELEVAVGEGLSVALTGWAVPVMSGVLAGAFVSELESMEVPDASQ